MKVKYSCPADRVDLKTAKLVAGFSDLKYKHIEARYTPVADTVQNEHAKTVAGFSDLKYVQKVSAKSLSETDTPVMRRIKSLQEITSDNLYKEEAKEIVEKCCSQYPFTVEMERFEKLLELNDKASKLYKKDYEEERQKYHVYPDTPEVKRVIDAAILQSDAKYREKYEKEMKGKGNFPQHITPVYASQKEAAGLTDAVYSRDAREKMQEKSYKNFHESPLYRTLKDDTDMASMSNYVSDWEKRKVDYKVVSDTPDIKRVKKAGTLASPRTYVQKQEKYETVADTPANILANESGKLVGDRHYKQVVKGKGIMDTDTPEMRKIKSLREITSDNIYKEEAKEIVEKCCTQYPFTVDMERFEKLMELMDQKRYKKNFEEERNNYHVYPDAPDIKRTLAMAQLYSDLKYKEIYESQIKGKGNFPQHITPVYKSQIEAAKITDAVYKKDAHDEMQKKSYKNFHESPLYRTLKDDTDMASMTRYRDQYEKEKTNYKITTDTPDIKRVKKGGILASERLYKQKCDSYETVADTPANIHAKETGKLHSDLPYSNRDAGTLRSVYRGQRFTPFDTPESNRLKSLRELASDNVYKEEAKELYEKCCTQFPYTVEMERLDKLKELYDKGLYMKLVDEARQYHLFPDCPEVKRVIDADKIQSDLVYKKAYEEARGKGYFKVTETPLYKTLVKAALDASPDHYSRQALTEMREKNYTAVHESPLYKMQKENTDNQSPHKYNKFPETRDNFKTPVDTPDLKRVKKAGDIASEIKYQKDKQTEKYIPIADTVAVRHAQHMGEIQGYLPYEKHDAGTVRARYRGQRFTPVDTPESNRLKSLKEIVSDTIYKEEAKEINEKCCSQFPLTPEMERFWRLQDLYSDADYRQKALDTRGDFHLYPDIPEFERLNKMNDVQSDLKYQERYMKELRGKGYKLTPDMPLYQRMKRVTAQNSDNVYKGEAKKLLGKSIDVTQTPEYARQQEAQKISSQSEYVAKDKERTHQYETTPDTPEYRRQRKVAKFTPDKAYQTAKPDLDKYHPVKDTPSNERADQAQKIQSDLWYQEQGRDLKGKAYTEVDTPVNRRVKSLQEITSDTFYKEEAQHLWHVACTQYPYTPDMERHEDNLRKFSDVLYKNKYEMNKHEYHPVPDSPELNLAKENAVRHSGFKYREKYEELKKKPKFNIAETQLYRRMRQVAADTCDDNYMGDYNKNIKGKGVANYAETPLYQRNKEAGDASSELKYGKDLKKIREGKGYTPTADTPQHRHVKKMEEIQSSVKYPKALKDIAKYATVLDTPDNQRAISTYKNQSTLYYGADAKNEMIGKAFKEVNETPASAHHKKVLDMSDVVYKDEAKRLHTVACTQYPYTPENLRMAELSRTQSDQMYKERGELEKHKYTTLANTPDLLHAKEVHDITSENKYKEEYNKERGKYSMVAQTPLYETAQKANKLTSETLYKKAYKALQGKGYALIDTPEFERCKQVNKLASRTKYHEDYEKSKIKGYTPVVDTPENIRLRQQSKIQSQNEYQKGYKALAGKFSYTADNPEHNRIRSVSKIQSQGAMWVLTGCSRLALVNCNNNNNNGSSDDENDGNGNAQPGEHETPAAYNSEQNPGQEDTESDNADQAEGNGAFGTEGVQDQGQGDDSPPPGEAQEEEPPQESPSIEVTPPEDSPPQQDVFEEETQPKEPEGPIIEMAPSPTVEEAGIEQAMEAEEGPSEQFTELPLSTDAPLEPIRTPVVEEPEEEQPAEYEEAEDALIDFDLPSPPPEKVSPDEYRAVSPREQPTPEERPVSPRATSPAEEAVPPERPPSPMEEDVFVEPAFPSPAEATGRPDVPTPPYMEQAPSPVVPDALMEAVEPEVPETPMEPDFPSPPSYNTLTEDVVRDVPVHVEKPSQRTASVFTNPDELDEEEVGNPHPLAGNLGHKTGNPHPHNPGNPHPHNPGTPPPIEEKSSSPQPVQASGGRLVKTGSYSSYQYEESVREVRSSTKQTIREVVSSDGKVISKQESEETSHAEASQARAKSETSRSDGKQTVTTKREAEESMQALEMQKKKKTTSGGVTTVEPTQGMRAMEMERKAKASTTVQQAVGAAMEVEPPPPIPPLPVEIGQVTIKQEPGTLRGISLKGVSKSRGGVKHTIKTTNALSEERSSQVTTSAMSEQRSSHVTTSSQSEQRASHVSSSSMSQERASHVATSAMTQERASHVSTSAMSQERASHVTSVRAAKAVHTGVTKKVESQPKIVVARRTETVKIQLPRGSRERVLRIKIRFGKKDKPNRLTAYAWSQLRWPAITEVKTQEDVSEDTRYVYILLKEISPDRVAKESCLRVQVPPVIEQSIMKISAETSRMLVQQQKVIYKAHERKYGSGQKYKFTVQQAVPPELDESPTLSARDAKSRFEMARAEELRQRRHVTRHEVGQMKEMFERGASDAEDYEREPAQITRQEVGEKKEAFERGVSEVRMAEREEIQVARQDIGQKKQLFEKVAEGHWASRYMDSDEGGEAPERPPPPRFDVGQKKEIFENVGQSWRRTDSETEEALQMITQQDVVRKRELFERGRSGSEEETPERPPPPRQDVGQKAELFEKVAVGQFVRQEGEERERVIPIRPPTPSHDMIQKREMFQQFSQGRWSSSETEEREEIQIAAGVSTKKELFEKAAEAKLLPPPSPRRMRRRIRSDSFRRSMSSDDEGTPERPPPPRPPPPAPAPPTPSPPASPVTTAPPSRPPPPPEGEEGEDWMASVSKCVEMYEREVQIRGERMKLKTIRRDPTPVRRQPRSWPPTPPSSPAEPISPVRRTRRSPSPGPPVADRPRGREPPPVARRFRDRSPAVHREHSSERRLTNLAQNILSQEGFEEYRAVPQDTYQVVVDPFLQKAQEVTKLLSRAEYEKEAKDRMWRYQGGLPDEAEARRRAELARMQSDVRYRDYPRYLEAKPGMVAVVDRWMIGQKKQTHEQSTVEYPRDHPKDMTWRLKYQSTPDDTVTKRAQEVTHISSELEYQKRAKQTKDRYTAITDELQLETQKDAARMQSSVSYVKDHPLAMEKRHAYTSVEEDPSSKHAKDAYKMSSQLEYEKRYKQEVLGHVGYIELDTPEQERIRRMKTLQSQLEYQKDYPMDFERRKDYQSVHDDPNTIRAKEATHLASKVEYESRYHKEKDIYKTVADTPEGVRVKDVGKMQSEIEYQKPDKERRQYYQTITDAKDSQRLKEVGHLQSQIEYQKDHPMGFEGRRDYQAVSDDPETLRVKDVTKLSSGVEYVRKDKPRREVYQTVTDDPEGKRMKEVGKLHSQLEYQKDHPMTFEGRLDYTSIADDPETRRVKDVTMMASGIEYERKDKPRREVYQTVTDDMESKRMKEVGHLQSQIEYQRDHPMTLEGRLDYTAVADDPETRRVKDMTIMASGIEYERKTSPGEKFTKRSQTIWNRTG
uniref:SH3 domain-containing protein n=1 Tax=Branchiostoma floridae TaxID=7739 RepID=C3ZH63_BRAFL|eukprot:XP_002592199.1 hypothetical protein BRAFLDRAFT_123945 [Branchiostoma floridae]